MLNAGLAFHYKQCDESKLYTEAEALAQSKKNRYLVQPKYQTSFDISNKK